MPPKPAKTIMQEMARQHSEHVLAVGILMDTFERILMELGVRRAHIRKVQEELTHLKLREKQKDQAEKDHDACIEGMKEKFL